MAPSRAVTAAAIYYQAGQLFIAPQHSLGRSKSEALLSTILGLSVAVEQTVQGQHKYDSRTGQYACVGVHLNIKLGMTLLTRLARSRGLSIPKDGVTEAAVQCGSV